MKKFMRWMLAAILICGANVFTSCSSDDDDDEEKKVENLTAEMLAGLWVTDYAASGTEGDKSWTRVVEAYQFKTDGTGYYESYRLDGEKLAVAEWTRDNCSFRFTISGSTVTIVDQTGDTWPLTYTASDGKLPRLTDDDGISVAKATAAQQTLVDQLYADWQAGNSGGDDDDDNSLNDVNGNVDINNGGGGVNEMR